MSDNNFPAGNVFSQRDVSKEHNQLRPRSLASSGSELDAGCEIEQSQIPATFDSHQSDIPTSPVDKIIMRRQS